MNILLTGPTGLIGSAVLSRLLAGGHRVLAFCQNPPWQDQRPGLQWCSGDFARRTRPKHWRSELPGIDAVINAAGLWRESFPYSFDLVHREAPAALFQACANYGVQRVIHLSIFGADANKPNEFWRSKALGDKALLEHDEYERAILRPTPVFTASAHWLRVLRHLAGLPLLPLPYSASRLQPVHLDDLAELIARIATQSSRPPCDICTIAGPESFALEDYVQKLRIGRGLTPARVWHVPDALLYTAAWLAESRRNSPLNRIVLDMLLKLPNPADDHRDRLEALLGRSLRPGF